MSEVPPQVLRAALYTLFRAAVFSRYYVRSENGPQAVYEIMDAVHEIPQILMRWGDDNNEEKLRMYFGYFDWKRFRELDPDSGAPDLVALFDTERTDDRH